MRLTGLILALLITGCGNGNDDNRAGPVGPTDPAAPAPASIAPDSIVGATFTYIFDLDRTTLACNGVIQEPEDDDRSPLSGNVETIRYESGRVIVDEGQRSEQFIETDWRYDRTGNNIGIVEFAVAEEVPGKGWSVLFEYRMTHTFNFRAGGSFVLVILATLDDDCRLDASGSFSVIYQ